MPIQTNKDTKMRQNAIRRFVQVVPVSLAVPPTPGGREVNTTSLSGAFARSLIICSEVMTWEPFGP